jgi:hypothetical protein
MDEHQMNTLAAQYMLCGLSDNPRQFREPPMSGLLRHAQREWERSQHRDDGGGMMTVPF